MVRQRTTTDRLGERLDRLPAATHRPANGRCTKSDIRHPSQGKKSNYQKSRSRRTNPSPVQNVRRCIQRPRIEEIPAQATLGPQDRTKTWSTCNVDQQNDQIINDGTRRTQEICRRTFGTRHHTMIQEPLCRIILLHQKEERQTKTSTRLPTNQQMDYQEQIPLTTDTPTDRPTR